MPHHKYRSTASYVDDGWALMDLQYFPGRFPVWNREAERLFSAIAEVVAMRPGPGFDYAKTLTIGCGRRLFTPRATYSDLDFYVGTGLPRFVCADACNLPFRDGVFDGCLSSHVLEHLDAQEALLEQARVTRVGGLVAAVVPDVRYTAGSDPTHVREWEQGQFTDYFSSLSDRKVAMALRKSGVAKESYSFHCVWERER